MKKITQATGKLQFRKQAIANLSKAEQTQVNGGKAAFTTSFGNCSGFLCCNPDRDIISDWTAITVMNNPDNGVGNNPTTEP